MKHKKRFGEYIGRILLLAGMLFVLVFALTTLRPQTPLAPQPVTATINSAYPPPQVVNQGKAQTDTIPSEESAYPPPVGTILPTRDPSSLVTNTPVPITPHPTLTIPPGPSPTPLPLIGPAEDNSGALFFIAKESKETKSKLHTLSTDSKGKALTQAKKLSDMAVPSNGIAFPSPDGTRLAIIEEWGALTIFSLEDGSIQKQMSLGGTGLFLNWFPDSRRILWSAGSLVITDLVTGEHNQIVFPGYGTVSAAAASPDGQNVVYSFSPDSLQEKGLWIVNSNGQNAHLLVKGVNPYQISWSPNGKKIVFGNTLQIVNSDGSDLHSLAPDFAITNPNCNQIPPRWSPDSKTLALFTIKESALCNDWKDENFKDANIVLIDIDSGKARHLLSDKSTGNIDPTWSPDGSQIAFVSNRGGTPEIWVVNLDGSNLLQVTENNHLTRFPVWKKTKH